MSVNVLNIKKLNPKNGKKGQIQTMQTVFILIIIIIILIIGFVVFVVFKNDSAKQSQVVSKERQSIEIASYILTIPEISCSLKGDVKQNCFDGTKLISFNSNKYLDYYYDYFGYSNISVKIIYPIVFVNENKLCTKTGSFPYPNCDTFNIYDNTPETWTSKEPFFIPVSIFNPITNEYNLGIANVEVYS
ncbi:MAG: hypothetical protein WC755_03435 [Candidatus Woesearchaeota archaeon]|jgi:hypothetical protein